MKKIKPIVGEISYRFGQIAVVLQSVLAFCWIAKHITELPLFAETESLMQAGADGRIDEYMGALYVGLIALFGAVERLVGIPFQVLIYLLQFAIGLCSVYFVASTLGRQEKTKALWISAYVNTFPFLLQSHFSVLPYSLGGSIYLFLIGVLIRLINEMNTVGSEFRKLTKHGVWVVSLWVLSGLVLPEYYLLSGALLVLCVLFAWISVSMKEEKSKRLLELRGKLLILVVIGAIVSGSLCLITTRDGSRGRMQNTASAQAVRRLAWPELFRMNDLWGREIRDTFSLEELAYYSAVPERVVDGFGPVLEKKYGRDKANQIYADMAYTAITSNTKAVGKQVLTDFAFYMCPQAMIALNLEGVGGTYTGWNYEKFRDNTVLLAEIYTSFGGCVFCAFGILTLLKMLFEKKKSGSFLWLAIVILVMQALSSTWLTGGMVSYLRCPVNMVLWGIAVVVRAFEYCREEGEGAQ